MCCAFIEVLVRSNSQLEKENSKRTMRLHCSAVQVTVWGGCGSMRFLERHARPERISFVLAHLHLLDGEKNTTLQTWIEARKKQNTCAGWKCWRWS